MTSEFSLADGDAVHVVPRGDYPHDSGVTQVIDGRALEEMTRRFRQESQHPNFPGLLVDFDHFSRDTRRPSEAAGWITDLKQRADGLFANVRWTSAGEAAVKGGRYRLVSPVFDDVERLGKNSVRPLHLASAALTNTPGMSGMVPLSNRRGSASRDASNAPQRSYALMNRDQAERRLHALKLRQQSDTGCTYEAAGHSVYMKHPDLLNASRQPVMANRGRTSAADEIQETHQAFERLAPYVNRMTPQPGGSTTITWDTVRGLEPAAYEKWCGCSDRVESGLPMHATRKTITRMFGNELRKAKSLHGGNFDKAWSHVRSAWPELFGMFVVLESNPNLEPA